MGLGLAVFGGWSAWGQRDGEDLTWLERIPLLGSWKSAPLWARGALLLTIPQLSGAAIDLQQRGDLSWPAGDVASSGRSRTALACQLLAGDCRRDGDGAWPQWRRPWYWGLSHFWAPSVSAASWTFGRRVRPVYASASGAAACKWPWTICGWGLVRTTFCTATAAGYILPAAWRDPSLNHPHNVVLDWWTRLGLPGLALAAAWLAQGIRSLWKAVTCRCHRRRRAGRGRGSGRTRPDRRILRSARSAHRVGVSAASLRTSEQRLVISRAAQMSR